MNDDEKALIETAKAVQEVAKTSGKIADLTDSAGRFLGGIMGNLVTDGFGLIEDRLRYYRFERAVLLADKTQRRLQEKGITNIRLVPPKIALPLIEHATIENDDDLHTLWSNLLASAMDADFEVVETKFRTVLSDITSSEAHHLRDIFKMANEQGLDPDITFQSDGGVEEEEALRSFLRLGIIKPAWVELALGYDRGEPDYQNPIHVYQDIHRFHLTIFGISFCKAVL